MLQYQAIRAGEKLQLYWRSILSHLGTKFIYITDSANWSFKWDAYYINKVLNSTYGLSVGTATHGRGYHGQFLHFGDRYAYLNGDYAHIDPSNIVTLTWFHGLRQDTNPRLGEMLEKLLAKQDLLSRIVVTCETSASILRNEGIKEDKLIIIPLGVDTKLFRPIDKEKKSFFREKHGIPPGAFCIGSFMKDGIGWQEGFEPKLEKGPDKWLEAVSTISRRHRNLFVILTGPARGYVKRGLDRMGVPYAHHHLEEYLDIIPFYQMSDLVMITSRTEGGPKTLLEAWAAGVPVVATKVGMCADYINSGVNGYLVDVDDSADLAEKASAVVGDGKIRDEFKINGLETVKNFDWELVGKQYWELLYKPLANIK